MTDPSPERMHWTYGWLPIALCPTDGVFRLVRLPDGQEVAAAFDGGDGLSFARRQWRTKTFAVHNPSRLTGEVLAGIPQMSAPYDTFLIADLPTGVYPTHFRPNDTIFGAPAIRRPPPFDVDEGARIHRGGMGEPPVTDPA